MTVIEPYSAECNECGHVMPFKLSLMSTSSFAPIPDDMDFSEECDKCGSKNIAFISTDEAFDKLKDLKQ